MRREEKLNRLKREIFDILVIGGGATGAGIALDGASRGLKVALVEKNDFASGTSSRSTKLLHGGVRYLELAVKQLDRGQLHLVKEALHERATLLKIAPHLTRVLPIVTPLYKWLEIPYYRIGLKAYDWLAGKTNLAPSRAVSPKEIISYFPNLKSNRLKGGTLYYDGQFDDARMAVSLILTSIDLGAVPLNYIEITELIKENGKIRGANIHDLIDGEKFPIRAKSVINATGPFADSIRKMDDPNLSPLLNASSGIHIILNKKLLGSDVGLLFPKTEDGRVLFMLPWLENTLVGTTDNPAKVEVNPKPTEEDIRYLLDHISKYLEVPIHRKDILSAWSGLRPLVSNSHISGTSNLSRDHFIEVSKAGLVSIIGGKWTTYRKMAIDTVNSAIQEGNLFPIGPSRTEEIQLIGAENYHAEQIKELQQKYEIDLDIAQHLSHAYGDQAEKVLQIEEGKYLARLADPHPFIEAELFYTIENEMAEHAIDILARRMRFGFLDIQAMLKSLPRAIELISMKLNWNEERQKKEKEFASSYFISG